MDLPSADEIASLKAKHGDLHTLEFGDTTIIHRRPSQAETDVYLLKQFRGAASEAAGNLVFTVRLWPDVAALEAAFEECPATVDPCANQILATVGADFADIMGAILLDVGHMKDEDRAELEARIGRTVQSLIDQHPRGSLKYARVPGIGPSIFRRPTRTSFAAFNDAIRADETFAQAFRDLPAECAITDEKALPSLYSRYPAYAYYLSWALAAHAGKHLEVKSGKL